jgi:hypothetical protein
VSKDYKKMSGGPGGLIGWLFGYDNSSWGGRARRQSASIRELKRIEYGRGSKTWGDQQRASKPGKVAKRMEKRDRRRGLI